MLACQGNKTFVICSGAGDEIPLHSFASEGVEWHVT